jgi:hypothetical protein
MGIKFNCPNGHKLNVKSFLAGKKGVCPHCGAKFRIPMEGGDDGDDRPAPAHGSNGTKPRAMAVAAPTGAGVPAMPPFPVGGVSTPVTMPAAAPVMPMSTGAGPYGAPAMPMMPAPAAAPAMPLQMPPMPSPALADAISEAPSASWYVRPPSGSQYGPARGDVMRKWIAEGRVSGDSLVWREGWPDWRTAGQVFPSLATAGGVAPSLPVPAPSPSPRTARIAAAGKKKKGGSGLAIAALILLGIVCLALVGVLVYVVTMK